MGKGTIRYCVFTALLDFIALLRPQSLYLIYHSLTSFFLGLQLSEPSTLSLQLSLLIEIREKFEITFLSNSNPNLHFANLHAFCIMSPLEKKIPLKFLYQLIYYTFYTGQVLCYLTKACCKICRAVRSYSVSCDVQSKLQIWIQFRA